MLPGDEGRSMYRRADIEQALASFAYTVTATGVTLDTPTTIKALCLAFGVKLDDVTRRVLEMDKQ